MNLADVEARFAQINKRQPEEMTAGEASSLAAAEAMDDGTTVSLEDFAAELD